MRIKEMRKEIKLSQRELGKMLNVNQAAVSQWELGLTVPTANKLPRLARALNCRIEDLYEKEELEFDESVQTASARL